MKENHFMFTDPTLIYQHFQQINQRLEIVEKENKDLTKKVADLQSWKQQSLMIYSVLPENIEFDLNNPRIQPAVINQIEKTFDIPINLQWAHITSKSALVKTKPLKILMQIYQLSEEANIVIGIVAKELKQLYGGCWNKNGSTLLDIRGTGSSLAYQNGSYAATNVSIQSGSTVIMLVNWENKKITWFLNGINKLAERNLPEGEVYASLHFKGRSVSRLL